MKCFNHEQIDAVGICKSCNKGICMECAHDTGNGLACKDTCIEEVKALDEIVERTKQMYSIGSESAPLSSGVLTYFMLAVLFCGWGLYRSFRTGGLDLFPVLMGFGM